MGGRGEESRLLYKDLKCVMRWEMGNAVQTIMRKAETKPEIGARSTDWGPLNR